MGEDRNSLENRVAWAIYEACFPRRADGKRFPAHHASDACRRAAAEAIRLVQAHPNQSNPIRGRND